MTAMAPHVVIFGAKFSEPPTSARPILYNLRQLADCARQVRMG